jgi:hypothetical protein
VLSRTFAELINRFKILIVIGILLCTGVFVHLSQQEDHSIELFIPLVMHILIALFLIQKNGMRMEVHRNGRAMAGFFEYLQHLRHDSHKPMVNAEKVVVTVPPPDSLVTPFDVPADLFEQPDNLPRPFILRLAERSPDSFHAFASF